MGPWQENGVTIADGVICDVSRRKWSELELQAKTAFLEAQANSTIDGILVVDAAGRRILQNRRFNEIFAIPAALASGPDDEPVLRHVTQRTKDPASFVNRSGNFTVIRRKPAGMKSNSGTGPSWTAILLP